MASYETKKNYTKSETIARRMKRATKYANATMTNKSGRVRAVAKASY